MIRRSHEEKEREMKGLKEGQTPLLILSCKGGRCLRLGRLRKKRTTKCKKGLYDRVVKVFLKEGTRADRGPKAYNH